MKHMAGRKTLEHMMFCDCRKRVVNYSVGPLSVQVAERNHETAGEENAVPVHGAVCPMVCRAPACARPISAAVGAPREPRARRAPPAPGTTAPHEGAHTRVRDGPDATVPSVLQPSTPP